MDFDKTGGTQTVSYTVDESCKDKIRVGTQTDDQWIGVSVSDSSITITVGENTSGERDGVVYLTVNNIPCPSKAIAVHQGGDACGCGDLKFASEATVQVGTPTEISVTTASCVTIETITSSNEVITARYENGN